MLDQGEPPVRLPITPGRASDKTAAPLLSGDPAAGGVVAGRGDDSLSIPAFVRARGGKAHIPPAPGPCPAPRPG